MLVAIVFEQIISKELRSAAALGVLVEKGDGLRGRVLGFAFHGRCRSFAVCVVAFLRCTCCRTLALHRGVSFCLLVVRYFVFACRGSLYVSPAHSPTPPTILAGSRGSPPSHFPPWHEIGPCLQFLSWIMLFVFELCVVCHRRGSYVAVCVVAFQR